MKGFEPWEGLWPCATYGLECRMVCLLADPWRDHEVSQVEIGGPGGGPESFPNFPGIWDYFRPPGPPGPLGFHDPNINFGILRILCSCCVEVGIQ